VRVYYADTSVIARAALPNEVGHAAAKALILSDEDSVLTSQWTLLELAAVAARSLRDRGSAVQTAFRDEIDRLVERRVLLLDCEQGLLLDRAREIAAGQAVKAMDAVHLAVADLIARPLATPHPLHFATSDKAQGRAADVLLFPGAFTFLGAEQ